MFRVCAILMQLLSRCASEEDFVTDRSSAAWQKSGQSNIIFLKLKKIISFTKLMDLFSIFIAVL